MDAVAENGREARSPRVSTKFSLGVENGRTDAGLDGMTEPVSRDRILRREREQEKILFPAQRTTGRIHCSISNVCHN